MSNTPDVRPVGDLPNSMGKTAARELKNAGIDSLLKASEHTEEELGAIHGVGPKAVRIIKEALSEKGLTLRDGGS
ncbi:hypothetical protein [Nesterenkonia natronophila]|uniref:DNA-binding protein n=1 Tax=Nesterenkonia natronophila TaxID=2174932 RepID=A0A3A4FGJ1_9MICC|nr:hypothetical protein [Nesterenkonia natronophila]RJN31415.1 hypothetical protein D3250_11340 [Nesterenkonia natronophila]